MLDVLSSGHGCSVSHIDWTFPWLSPATVLFTASLHNTTRFSCPSLFLFFSPTVVIERMCLFKTPPHTRKLLVMNNPHLTSIQDIIKYLSLLHYCLHQPAVRQQERKHLIYYPQNTTDTWHTWITLQYTIIICKNNEMSFSVQIVTQKSFLVILILRIWTGTRSKHPTIIIIIIITEWTKLRLQSYVKGDTLISHHRQAGY
jgi:hypothetical protein